MDAKTPVRPFLKWAGGKRWLIPSLAPIWQSQSNRRLVEPFAGGLAISLGLLPKTALLNDSNPHLINLYNWVKKGLISRILQENDPLVYYRHRERFNQLIAGKKHRLQEAACLFYYLNRTGFNGLCRFNNSGYFNVPFGRYKTIDYRKDFTEYAPLFRDWEFTSKDFQELTIRDSDFIYADPPYDVEFTSYSAGGFSWEDQVRLVDWLAKHPGPVVLSNQATPRIRELYQDSGYRLRYLDAPRRISCTGDRKPAREVLATRNL